MNSSEMLSKETAREVGMLTWMGVTARNRPAEYSNASGTDHITDNTSDRTGLRVYMILARRKNFN